MSYCKHGRCEHYVLSRIDAGYDSVKYEYSCKFNCNAETCKNKFKLRKDMTALGVSKKRKDKSEMNGIKCIECRNCPYYESETSYCKEELLCKNTDCALYEIRKEESEQDDIWNKN